jgi:hypothetical protein
MIDRAQRRGAGGAGVGHVVHGDAGLADLLLELLADRARAAHQVAGGEHAHVLHRDAAVGEGAEGGLGSEVEDVLVLVLAELRHRDAEDVDVVGHDRFLSCSCAALAVREALRRSDGALWVGVRRRPR